MRYLYISYNTDKSLRDTQWYETLEQVKSERGITSKWVNWETSYENFNGDKEVLERTRVASHSSPDRSGCYILDFNNKSIDDIDTTHASAIMKLMISVKRELTLREVLSTK